ncbi:MAG: acyl-CoA thioesterase [Acidobacteriaceae bacterium]|nr:acyl-CoA thioesterase [Acidobacteriaceae bacterium]
MQRHAPFRFQTRIRFIDTDASGRIHYTAMFRYFESAELEYMRALGLLYGTAGIALPRVHVECDFVLAIVYDDLVDIEVCLTKLGRSSIRLDFRTLKGEELAARGAVVIVCMDKKTQRAVELPAEFRKVLAAELRDQPA